MWSPARLSINVRQRPCASGLLGAILGCLDWFRDERDQTEVAGLTGLAFALHVDETVSPASLSAFPWALDVPAALARLGYDVSIVHADETDPRVDDARSRAVDQVIAAVCVSRPSILWGVQVAQFGLVRGFDREARTIEVSGVLDGRGGAGTMPWDRVGRGEVPVVFACTLDRRSDVDPDVARTAALRHAAAAAHGLVARAPAAAAGPAAWATWREAIDTMRIDPAGHALVAAVAAEARAAAAAWLTRAAGAPGASEGIAEAAAAYRTASTALAELSAAWPFPLPDGALLGSIARREHLALLDTAAAAEARGAAALARAAEADRRRASSAGVTITATGVSAGTEAAGAERLFACIRDLPLGGLDREAAELRAAPAPLAQLAVDAAGEVVGHVYYAPLDGAGAGVVADDGRYLYVYCVWVAQERRRAGIGQRLLDAVLADAAARGCDGVLAEATGQAIFLHHEAYRALGFAEIDEQNDDARLMFRAVPGRQAATPPRVRLWSPTRPPRGRGALPVVVSHGRPCPLLLRHQRNVAAAARAVAAAGLPIELQETAAAPHGVTVAGVRLPLGYVPEDTARAALTAAARAWTEEETT